DARQHGDHLAMALAAVGGGEPESAFDRDIDVERTRTALARPAEQAGVKHALRGDQHQMARFAAVVVHGSSSTRGALAAAMGSTIAENRSLSRRQSRHSGARSEPQMRNCASGNLEIPGSMLRIAPE